MKKINFTNERWPWDTDNARGYNTDGTQILENFAKNLSQQTQKNHKSPTKSF